MMAGRKADTRESQMVGSTEVMKVRKTVPKKENWRVHPKAFWKEDPMIVLLDDQMAKMRVWWKVDRRVSETAESRGAKKVPKTAAKKELWKVHPKAWWKDDAMIVPLDDQMAMMRVVTTVERRVSQKVLSMDILMALTMAQQKENWRVHPKDYAKEDPMIDRSDEPMETWKVRTMDEPKVSTTEHQTAPMKEPSMVHGTE